MPQTTKKNWIKLPASASRSIVYDPKTKTTTIVLAGHVHPIIFEEETEVLPRKTPPRVSN